MAIPRNFPYMISGEVQPFDIFDSVDLASGASGQVVQRRMDDIQFALGYITIFGHGIDTLAAFVDSVFRIQIDGANDFNYGAIADQLGLFSDPRVIVPITFKFGQTISVFAENNDTVQHKYGARLQGFLDRKLDKPIPIGFK